MAGTIRKKGTTTKGQERFYLDLFWKGKQYKIYSDKTGQPLDTYQRAVFLQSQIDSEIKTHAFDPTNYIKADLTKYQCRNLLGQFLEDKLDTLAPSYRTNYKRLVEEAQDFFSSRDVRELRKMDLLDYLKALSKKGLSEKSQKNYLDLVRVFVGWCRDRDIRVDGIGSWPRVEVPAAPVHWIDSTDQQKILETLLPEDRPIYTFLMLHGCRPGEARALKVKDVNLESQLIMISCTFSDRTYREHRKGRGKPYVLPIHPELLIYIKERVESNLPEAWLFPNPRTGRPYTRQILGQRWRGALRKLGFSGPFLYAGTRHSFASQLLNQGVPLDQVQDLMGHTNSKTTSRYAHRQVESLRGVIEKLATVPGVSLAKGAVSQLPRIAKKK